MSVAVTTVREATYETNPDKLTCGAATGDPAGAARHGRISGIAHRYDPGKEVTQGAANLLGNGRWGRSARAAAGKEKGQTPRPAGRKKPSARQQKAPVRKKKAGPVDKARSGNPARHPKTPVRARGGSKKDKVLALLKRRQGATLKELMKATGWQAHSVRGFLSGTIAKKMGLRVRSEKRDDGERVYSIQE